MWVGRYWEVLSSGSVDFGLKCFDVCFSEVSFVLWLRIWGCSSHPGMPVGRGIDVGGFALQDRFRWVPVRGVLNVLRSWS